MKTKYLSIPTLCLLLIAGNLTAQHHTNHLGVGNSIGVTVNTSSNSNNNGGLNTVNGYGMQPDLLAASRFLAHATLGASYQDIQHCASTGYSAWIDEQMALPASTHLADMQALQNIRLAAYVAENGSQPQEFLDFVSGTYRLGWWQTTMTANDYLRQRVAFALSEIFVVSERSDLVDMVFGLADYYDMLASHAFANYRNLLEDVTLHPCMGYFLSHMNNPKSNPDENVHPDENYAREIMQLFSIGLYKLNMDGSYQLDADGNYIPTYNNNDIKQMAKIFTGLTAGANYYEPNEPVEFGADIWGYDFTVPMQMYEEWHETGSKTLLDGYIVPNGQTGMQDINSALDMLFNHQNVPPFISRLLIQRLVKSNPSPEYIERVANVFVDNGSGIRGDLGMLVRTILLDPEARSCDFIDKPTAGMLREPFIRYVHFLKAFNLTSNNTYWNDQSWDFEEACVQHPMSARSVFNFFLPNYQPNGVISEFDYVAPEFQIHTATTAISYINFVHWWALWEEPFWEANGSIVELNLATVEGLANSDLNALLDHLDLLLTYGTMSENTRNIILNAITPLDDPYDKMVMALYLTFISPDYVVIR